MQEVKSFCVEGFLCYIKTKEKMQIKYLSALKTKYASFGLSKEALDRVASQRVKTIANEDEIDSDIASSETALLVMKEMQGATDALRANNAKIQKELADLKTQNEVGQKEVAQPENPYAKEIADMKELLQSMTTKFAEAERRNRDSEILSGANERMKALGCTNDFIRDITLKGIEIGDADTADSIAERYRSVYDKNCKSAFGDGYVPPKGERGGADEEVDFSAMVAGLRAAGSLPNKN